MSMTREQMDRFEKLTLTGDPDIEYWSSYVGQGAVRFVLSFDVQPAKPNFGQTIIVAKDLAALGVAVIDADKLGHKAYEPGI